MHRDYFIGSLRQVGSQASDYTFDFVFANLVEFLDLFIHKTSLATNLLFWAEIGFLYTTW